MAPRLPANASFPFGKSLRVFCFVLILLSIGARFVQIDSTVIGWHSWRQADTAALARNFHDSGEGILYPRVDWGGGGYVETEFQLYTYAVSLLYGVFGVHESLGRLLSVLMSVLAIIGLYRLTRRFSDEETAVFAATIYAVLPLSMFYSRAFMPESTLLAMIIWGLYYFDLWRSEGKVVHGVLAWLTVTAAVLLKIPTLYIGLPLLFIAWTHAGSVRTVALSWSLWVFALALFGATALWYVHAHDLYLQSGNTFGIWSGSTDKWGNYSSLLTLKFYNDIFFKSIAERHLTWPGMLLFLYGLTMYGFTVRRSSRRDWFPEVWLLAVFVYILVVNKGNQVHEYYQLPFIPPAVIVIARAWRRILSNAARLLPRYRRVVFTSSIVFVAAILLLSVFRYVALLSGESDRTLIRFARQTAKVVPENERILEVGDGNPVTLYLAGRKGWIANCGSIEAVPVIPRYVVLHEDEAQAYGCPAFQRILDGGTTAVSVGGHHCIVRGHE